VIAAIVIEGGLLALALLFVVALLRSHAEILRRLAALEGPEQTPRPAAGESGSESLAGQTLRGDAVKLALGAGAPRTLLAFLSSGCAACGPLWEGLREGAPALPTGTRLVIVTKGPDRESPARLEALGPAAHELVMSNAAWEDFAVPVTPHFVLVGGGDGRVLGRGSAGSWDQIAGFVRDSDADLARERGGGLSSSERAARAESALTGAGIGEGHPSLYPTRVGGGGGPT
jgi:hypothetical protein